MPATDGSLSIPITLSRGGRMFLRALEDPLTDAPPRPAGLPSEATGSDAHSLLGTAGHAQSVKQMLAELEAAAAAQSAQRPAGGGGEPSLPPQVVRAKARKGGATDSNSRGSMWVDKYAPKKFTDLLSPDDVNRNVLRWVKLWDFKVFGKPVKHTTTAHHNSSGHAGKHTAGGQRTLDRALGGGAHAHTDSKGGGNKWGDKGDKGGKFGKWGDKKHKFDGPPKPGDGSFMGFGYGWRADSKLILLAGPAGHGQNDTGRQHVTHSRVQAD